MDHTDIIEGFTLSCGQQSAEAYPEDSKGQNRDKVNRNTETLSP